MQNRCKTSDGHKTCWDFSQCCKHYFTIRQDENKWAMFDRHNMCFYYLMGFCGSMPQTWLSADNTLEFFKGSNFSKTGQKEKGSKTVQLCNSVINRCSTLQLPLTFLLGGVTHRCLVKLAVVALNLYLALFQTSRKILCTRKPACFSQPAFTCITKNPIFLMLLHFHDTTIIFQEDIYFPNSQSLIYSHSILYWRKVARALLMSQDTTILILNSWEMILHGRGQV